MNNNAIERIAAAVNALRPEWPAAQVSTLISTKFASRPAQDVAVALAFVACDPATKSPYRVIEAGPWWRIGTVADSTEDRRWVPPKREEACPEHMGEYAGRCRACEADRKAGDKPLGRTRRSDPPPDLLANLRESLRKRPTNPEPRDLRGSTDFEEEA